MENEMENELVSFAGKVAKVMDDLRSSQVFFILTQAYPENEDWEWTDFQALLTRIIKEANENTSTSPIR